MPVENESKHPVIGLVILVLGLALAGVAVALSAAITEPPSPQELAESRASDELLAARRSLEMATLEMVTLRMADAIDLEGDRRERLEQSGARADEALASIIATADGTGVASERAATLLAELEVEVDAPESFDAWDTGDLFDVAEDSARYAGANSGVQTSAEAIQQLSFVATLPLHVIVEGIAADASVNERSISEEEAAFFERMTTVVREEGGWFGTNATEPLENSRWIIIDRGQALFPDVANELSASLIATDLIEYDAWMRSLDDTDQPPPYDVEAMLAAADLVGPELIDAIDALAAEEQSNRAAALAEAETQNRTLRTGRFVAACAALILVLVGMAESIRFVRQTNDRAELALIDALTGVGNRHQLDELTRLTTEDPRYRAHLVAMIDLDAFKMINDVHGHPAGDAVLIAVANALEQLAERTERTQPGVATSVTRMGGDEFLFTAHAQDRLDENAIRQGLDCVRNDAIVVDGEEIPLLFSVGLTVADGQHELADLMRTADLDVYEDKARRTSVRRHVAPVDTGRSETNQA